MRGRVHPMRPKGSDLSLPCADRHWAAGQPDLVRRQVAAASASTSRAARNLSSTSRPRELSDARLAVRIAAGDAESQGTYARCMTHAVLRLCARTRMIQMWHQAKRSASGSSGNVWSSD